MGGAYRKYGAAHSALRTNPSDARFSGRLRRNPVRAAQPSARLCQETDEARCWVNARADCVPTQTRAWADAPKAGELNRRLPNVEPQNFEVNAVPSRQSALTFMIRTSSIVNLRFP
jgi:hypothetical protein